MPINLHLYLRIVFQAAGFLGGPILVSMNMKQIEALGINGILALVGSVFLGAAIPSAIFHFLIPARCPKCSDRSFVHEGRPITYRCKSCGFIHKTSLSISRLKNSGN